MASVDHLQCRSSESENICAKLKVTEPCSVGTQVAKGSCLGFNVQFLQYAKFILLKLWLFDYNNCSLSADDLEC